MKKFLVCVMFILTLVSTGQTTWVSSSTGYASQGIVDIAVAPNNHVFVLGYGVNVALNPYPVIARSTTGGNTWQMLSLGNSGISVPTAIIFSGNTLLMCGSNQSGTINYLYRSNNLGQTWTLSTTGINSSYRLVDFATAPNGDVYLLGYIPVGGYGTPKLLSSFNGGQSWGEISMTGIAPIIPKSIYFNSNGKLFCSGSNAFANNYLDASTNFGVTWVAANAGVPSSSEVIDFTFGNSGEIFSVCTNNFVPQLMKSTNNGGSWSVVPGVTGINNLVYSRSVANSGGNLIWIGSGTGATQGPFIFKSLMPNKATVSTFSATDVSDVNAVGSLNLTNDGGDLNTAHGLCWDTAPNPSVSTSQTVSTGAGLGIFTVQINNLQPSTTYYVRAFATNSIGLSYGNQITFTTEIASEIKTIERDRTISSFPNPSSNFIYPNGFNNTKSVTYSIFDMSGKFMFSEKLNETKNRIDISALQKGVYNLVDENGHRTKIVKD